MRSKISFIVLTGILIAVTFFGGMLFDAKLRTNKAEYLISRRYAGTVLEMLTVLQNGDANELEGLLERYRENILNHVGGERLAILSDLNIELQKLQNNRNISTPSELIQEEQ